jgi:hypothetical protein
MKYQIKLYTLLAISFLVLSCNKSVSVDFVSGLTTKGDGLSVDNIYLSDGKDKIETTEFIYGKKFYLNFNNITGFEKENGFVFPGMEFIILNKAGDTIMYNKDLYANQTKGFNISPLLLNSSLIVAKPINSKEEYTLISNIWDKKGDGKFSAEMDFEVVPNPNIEIENDGLTAKEVYLTSVTNNDIITETSIGFNEKIQLNVEGLEGFEEINGTAEIKFAMKVTDDNDNIILENDNLLGDAPLNAELVKQNLAATLIMQKGRLSNPITCVIVVEDRKSNSKMTVTSELTVE